MTLRSENLTDPVTLERMAALLQWPAPTESYLLGSYRSIPVDIQCFTEWIEIAASRPSVALPQDRAAELRETLNTISRELPAVKASLDFVDAEQGFDIRFLVVYYTAVGFSDTQLSAMLLFALGQVTEAMQKFCDYYGVPVIPPAA